MLEIKNIGILVTMNWSLHIMHSAYRPPTYILNNQGDIRKGSIPGRMKGDKRGVRRLNIVKTHHRHIKK